VPWGSSLSGYIKIPSDTSNIYACKPLGIIKKPENQTNIILYVERGMCSFVTKAFNAQLAGA